MNGLFKLPLYIKIAAIFVCVFLFAEFLYIGQRIILPLIYAMMFSVVITPLVIFLEKRKVKRIIAILVALILAMAFAIGILYLVASQLSHFEKSLPAMKTKSSQLIEHGTVWISEKFHVQPEKVTGWLAKSKAEMMDNGSSMLGKTLITISGLLVVIFLIPVYIFMILYYEPLLLGFLQKLFAKTHQQKLEEVLLQTKAIVQGYLSGLMIEAFIIATLNSVALLLLGIDYAILLGIIGALLNVIPFIGGIISVALPMAVALLTKSSPSFMLLVLAAYMLIQFFDNHYITPKIVASKVKINALVAIIVVFIGDAFWGIPGMFLSIPITAIVKVVFEHIEPLKPWAFLLGDTMPSTKMFLTLPKRRPKKMAT